MTSTSTFQGMNIESKPSSRVLAPPGGGSNNIFGSSEPVQAPPKREPAVAPAKVESAPVPQSNQGERYVRAAPKQAYNPITGQPYDQPQQSKKNPVAEDEYDDDKEERENEKKPDNACKPSVEAKEKTSTRIAQPPGGKSSGLW